MYSTFYIVTLPVVCYDELPTWQIECYFECGCLCETCRLIVGTSNLIGKALSL